MIPFGDVGVGEILGGWRIRGRFPLAAHYAMCGLRHFDMRRRLVFWGMALRALFGT